jgi:pimeloyl-ACP methyl ester carboxylesterase
LASKDARAKTQCSSSAAKAKPPATHWIDDFGAMKRFLKLISLLVLLILVGLFAFRTLAHFRETETAQALAPPNGQFIQTSYGAVHVTEWGSMTSPVVVMTHGMAAWGGLWTDTAQHLAANGYHVIAFDQAPFGFSDASNEDFSISAEADRIGQSLATLNIHHAKLVGHSFGGGVAIETALRFPQFFDGVVLVCPVTKLGKTDASRNAAAPWPLRQTWISEVLVSATITNPLMTKLLLQKFMAKKDMATAEHIRILQMPMNRAGNTHAMAVWLRQFFEGDPNAKIIAADAAQQFTLPVSFIWGAEDQVVPLEEARRLKVLLRSDQLEIIPGVGHMPQLEAPGVFKNLLLKQIESMRAAGLSAP